METTEMTSARPGKLKSAIFPPQHQGHLPITKQITTLCAVTLEFQSTE